MVSQLFESLYAAEGYQLTIDLAAQEVRTSVGDVYSFEVDAFRKHCLLNGLDDIGLTLESESAIREFEQRHRASSPWLFDVIQ